MGTEQLKKFDGMFVYSEDAAGMSVMISVGGGEFKTVGNLMQDEQYIKFPEKGENAPPRGTTLNIKFAGASKGAPPIVQGIITYFSPEEESPSGRRPK